MKLRLLRNVGSLGFTLALLVACGGRSVLGNLDGSPSSYGDVDAGVGGGLGSGGDAGAGAGLGIGSGTGGNASGSADVNGAGGSNGTGTPAGGAGTSGGASAGGTAAGGVAAGGVASGGTPSGGAAGTNGVAGAPSTPGLCEYGSYDTDLDDDALSCETWTVCQPGSYEYEIGGYTYDRACEPCPDGTVSVMSNALSCESWRRCAFGQRIDGAPSPAMNRSCSVSEDFPPRPGIAGPFVLSAGGVELLVSAQVDPHDTTVESYSFAGEHLGSRVVANGENDQIFDMAQIGDELFVVGALYDGAWTRTAFVRKMAADGSIEWERELSLPGEYVNGMAAASNDDTLYVVAYVYEMDEATPALVLSTLDAEGTVTSEVLEDETDLATYRLDVAVATSGRVYVADSRSNSEGLNFAVVKEYETTGELVTEMAFEAEYWPRVESDGNGGAYVLSSANYDGDLYGLRHVAPDLEELLLDELIDEEGLTWLELMTVTEDGILLVGATSSGPALLRADLEGQVLSTDVLPEWAVAGFTGVRELEDGTVLVAGTSYFNDVNAAFVARWPEAD